ncbi:MAG: hydrolase [Labilithrix sp.]|nr:hydrolase [Labilithrix sp.]
MMKSAALPSIVIVLLAGLGALAACGTDAAGTGDSALDGGGAGSSGGPGGGALEGGTGDGGGPDRGDDAGPYVPPAPCTRGADAVTAPASLYDALVTDLAALGPEARAARVDAFLADVAAKGGTPLEDPATGRAIFVVRGAPANGSWSVVGSFSGFDKTKGYPMTQVAGTDLWVADQKTIPRTTSATYKLLDGAEDSGIAEDRLARNVVWDGIARGGMGAFNAGQLNAVVHPAALPMTRGRLTIHGTVHATQLANDRRVLVYFPAKYDDGTCGKLPTILFQDGNETVTRGDYPGVADALYAADPALSAVLVFAELAPGGIDERSAEYTFGTGTKGAAYVDFLASDLWPAIRTAYRTCSLPAARGLSGASYGGLIATFAAFERPSEWGWVGAQSASYWWSDSALVTRAATTSPKIDVRFFLDSSDQAADNVYDVDNMAAALTGQGYTVERVKLPVADPAAHDWKYFKLRGPQLLTDFRSGITACD